MKQKVIYNIYYENFSAFKSAIFGFFGSLSESTELATCFKSRIRDRFRSMGRLTSVS